MATNFKLKRSSVASKRPGLSNLELGELALNTYDGFLFTERNGLGITTVTNLTPWYENYGAGSIFYTNKVGIGTTAVPDSNQLLVKGGTETDRLNVTGISTHVGIATFNGATFHDDVNFVGANYNARWDKSGSNLEFDDFAELTLGTGNDLRIYHGSGYNYFRAGSSNSEIHIKDNTNGNVAKFKPGGNNELYFNTVKKFETTSTGITVAGTVVSTGADINGDLDVDGHTNLDNVSIAGVSTFTGNIDANGDLDVDGHTNLDNVSVAGVATVTGTLGSGDITITSNQPKLSLTDSSNNPDWSVKNANGNFAINDETASATRFSINSSNGVEFHMHAVPSADSTYDLGLTGTRWRNVYADTLYGDGSNLTGITGTTINNNADNRIITGSGTANTLNAHSSFTFDGTKVQIGGVTGPNNAKLFVAGTNSTNYVTIRNTSAADSSGSRWSSVRFQGTQSGGEVSDLVHLQANHEGSSDDQKGAFQIQINDGNDGDSLQERMHLYSTNSTSQPIVKFISSNSGEMLNLQNSSGGGQGMVFGVDTSGSNDTTYLRNNTSAHFDFTFYMGSVSSTYERIRIKQDEFRNSTQFFSNKTTLASNKTITTSYNNMTIGNITINSGVTVTVNSGARWVIV